MIRKAERKIRKYLYLAVVITVSLFLTSQISLYQEARENLMYFRKVFINISDHYVEMVNMPELLNRAIKAMVNELDPYTEYIEHDAKNKMRLITEGDYGGLGMEIGMRDDKITIIAPIEDTPAQKAGIRAGDIINKIDGKEVKGLSLDKVSQKLRGEVGTKIELEIIRPGVDEKLIFKLERAEIHLKDVPQYSFIEPGIAYVKLAGFSDSAPAEFNDAIDQLEKEDEIKGFILDLRNNPGGLLSSAVKIANTFLDKGKIIVSTKGQHEAHKEYVSFEHPRLPDAPLIVLVDNGSASASEIVTGAIQDHDRGIIVGDTTYGKGLVQKLIPIDETGNVQLKMTMAKYFTPSGRCIQREDYKLKHQNIFIYQDKDSLLVHDSYKTDNGRVVYSGGGIVPDVVVKNEKFDPVIYSLWSKNILFGFMVDYLSKHPELREIEEPVISQDVINDFYHYLKIKDIKYQSYEQKMLKKSVEKLGKREDLQKITKVLEKEIVELKKADSLKLRHNKDDIKWALLLELSSVLERDDWHLRVLLQKDTQIKKAIDLINDSKAYKNVLVRK